MTGKEANNLVETLGLMYDIVRFIDVAELQVCNFDKNGKKTVSPKQCSDIWFKTGRCENCISAKSCTEGKRTEKFEFAKEQVFHVTSQAVEIDGKIYALEGATSVKEDTMFMSMDKTHFINAVTENNKKLYIDPLTNAYNRRYFDEQLAKLGSESALAIIDIDNFKGINDTYGHVAGDLVLTEVVRIIKSKIRPADAVIRYGGDEFVITFLTIPPQVFYDKLESIRKAISLLTFPKELAAKLKVSVSIGGKCGNTTKDHLLKDADKLLYKAKETKNKVIAE